MNNIENILANATEEQIIEARDWASDCIGLTGGEKVGAERAVKYIEMNYPGGWAGFLAEIFPVEPEAAPAALVSGYTNCACRNCQMKSGVCLKVAVGPSWVVRRPNGRESGPFSSHAEAAAYARRVPGGGTPMQHTS